MTKEHFFQKGETVPIWADVRNWSDVLVDPSEGVTITLTSPTGVTIRDGVAMTKSEIGKYVTYYNTTTDSPSGWWKAKTIAQDGTGESAKYTITLGGFSLQ